MVEYGILGPLTCHDDGQAVELGGSRTRAVLAILLLERDRVVSADRLIELVWGEDPPPTAETALQGHVSRLRRILGRWAIETRPPGYLLRAEPGAVDAERFASLVDRARAASPSDAGGMLREALALWRGTPLADVADEPFAQAEIARLDELRMNAIEARIDADLASRRHAEVIGELDALIAEFPYRERLHGQRMLALYRSGRQTEALAAYGIARTALDEGMGIDPGPELQALEARILQQDPTLMGSPSLPATPPAVTAGPPHVPASTPTSVPPTDPMGAVVSTAMPGSGIARKTVTVVFADVAGSTALGEQLDPEVMRALMTRYFASMSDAIERHGGTVEKFIGDAVMAVFGIPTVHEDDALRAVRAADEMRTMLARIGAELESSRGLSLRTRIGVNTGEVGTSSGTCSSARRGGRKDHRRGNSMSSARISRRLRLGRRVSTTTGSVREHGATTWCGTGADTRI